MIEERNDWTRVMPSLVPISIFIIHLTITKMITSNLSLIIRGPKPVPKPIYNSRIISNSLKSVLGKIRAREFHYKVALYCFFVCASVEAISHSRRHNASQARLEQSSAHHRVIRAQQPLVIIIILIILSFYGKMMR